MQITPTALPDVLLVEPKVFGDERGFFFESWNRRAFVAAGIDAEFVQDNHSRSVRGVLRGLHYQIEHAQGKLVRVTEGEVFDVAVDLRRSSPSFGRSVGVVLSAANRRMLWIPPGFAHGFVVLSDNAEFLYKATDYWYPQHERTLLWSDPALRIDWPLDGLPTLAAKDAAGRRLADADLYD
jgi:dTDP-4-dehydrorhamnose 3,5-epimerase